MASTTLGGQTELDKAQKLYDRTQYAAALQVLIPLAEKDSPSPALFAAVGRNLLMEGEFKRSGEYFEKAIRLESNNSEYYHWLGKAYGRRAEVANPFTAPSYATKARQNFEKAVILDSKNVEAINDLFEYYLDAPGFLGGGIEKAAQLSNLIAKVDPAEYHFALATIAERRKEYQTAEQHFRTALEMAPRQVGRVLDLAKFLAKRGRETESEALFAQAEKLAPLNPHVWFDRANLYIHSKKNLPVAKELLERYLKSPLTPEDPSREEAQKLLRLALAGA